MNEQCAIIECTIPGILFGVFQFLFEIFGEYGSVVVGVGFLEGGALADVLQLQEHVDVHQDHLYSTLVQVLQITLVVHSPFINSMTVCVTKYSCK